jgi:hypothetical protein
LKEWKKFEEYSKSKDANKDHFQNSDIDNYYKGRNVDSDIKEFF